ncbi:hypothetical protein CPB86DRAFT_472732 [Serendipita vermifera]|nr:hypothetical protein CPB86DRAFT_472732 [Serendipita vermifera]
MIVFISRIEPKGAQFAKRVCFIIVRVSTNRKYARASFFFLTYCVMVDVQSMVVKMVANGAIPSFSFRSRRTKCSALVAEMYWSKREKFFWRIGCGWNGLDSLAPALLCCAPHDDCEAAFTVFFF